ncbi:hypothetical protein PR048_016990 [Dryococelus australis]|uniref:U6 small nuclear RNA (adenine-(43)-N(6))-methyltransferase n=1 Tax=Dryococelus australis TaxID=614101 RepID=A0ABQ9H8A8_9NEOP|nr:hypothetical protein PR048_016990 [Dryococelus australis]
MVQGRELCASGEPRENLSVLPNEIATCQQQVREQAWAFWNLNVIRAERPCSQHSLCIRCHPRIMYCTPPNFKEMAIRYPKFRKFAIQELSGRMTIDFKNPAALQALTITLLEKDFGLNVEIPLDRLVPTVPSRFNYVLWIEDLLQAAGSAGIEVRGIDIGAGASCIYSLLAAKTKGWHMLATEVDSDSYKYAVENVHRNNLQHLVQVKQTDTGVVLQGIVSEGQQYDFCMCNPPFFSSEEELDSESKSRSPARPPPHSCRTGSPSDVVVSGGEVAFISRIIEESKELGTMIRIYSSLLGHKSSMDPVKSLLQKAGVSSMVDTAFCQGRTTRWYIAWTFVASCNLQQAQHHDAQPYKKKDKPPLRWVVPQPSDSALYTLTTVGIRVKEMLQQLQMSVRGLRSNDKVQSFQVTAFNNTWSNQRKKRRAAVHSDSLNKDDPASTIPGSGQQSFKHSTAAEVPNTRCDARSASENASSNIGHEGEAYSECAAAVGFSEMNGPAVAQEMDPVHKDTGPGGTTGGQSVSHKRKLEDIISLSKKLKTDMQGCLLRAGVMVSKSGDDIHLEMTFVEGTGGRESLHQVMQYFKNRLKL